MGGRESKITVTTEGGGYLPPTGAALDPEYTNSKQRGATLGKVAWDFQNYTTLSPNKEKNTEEVLLVDRESAQGSTPSSTAAALHGSSSGKPKQTTPEQTGARGILAAMPVSPPTDPHKHAAAVTDGTCRLDNKAGAGTSAAAVYPATTGHTHAKPQALAGTSCDNTAGGHKPKRPATGKKTPDERSKNAGSKAQGMPTPPSPHPPPAAANIATATAATAVTTTAVAVAATAVSAAGCVPETLRARATAAANTTQRAVAAPAAGAVVQQRPAGAMKPAATPTAAAQPQTAAAGAPRNPDGAAATAASAASVQWVIRPGPPIESAYKLGKVLGQGSFGVVRGATHLVSGAEVAVKTIRKSLLAAADVGSLRREVEILHHLSGHPAISQLLGVYEEPRQLHLVLELYRGGDLFDAIIGVGRHSERTAADVTRTVLTAIAYCHAMGVAHRDIKPENFMLTAELPKSFPEGQQPQQVPGGATLRIPLAAPLPGIGARLKLIDFGLSAFCTDETPLTEIVGTSYYVAPEVLEGRYGLAADVWSAGIILHIMLTGYAPFDGKDDREILRAVRKGKLDLSKDPVWTSISPEAAAVLTAMLERDPAKRATADQVLSMPWIGRTAAICEAPAVPLPGVVSERMRRFARMTSFQKEARRVVAGLMRPEEVAGLVAQFHGLDRDRDGRVSLAELREGLVRQSFLRGGPAPSPFPPPGGALAPALSEEQLRELLQRSDLNGDGVLDESEFLAAALPAAALLRQALAAAAAAAAGAAVGAPPRPPPSPHGISTRTAIPATIASRPQSGNAIAAAFKHFDEDGSGFITVEELRQALATHHPSGRGSDVEALLCRHDLDADGRISYPEFVEMLVQDVDGDNKDDVYDTAMHGRRQQQHQHQTPPSGGGGGGSTRGGGVGGSGGVSGGGGEPTAGRCALRSRGSATAWVAAADSAVGVGGATGAAAAARGASRAVSRRSTVAAQLPSGHISPLEWSDECVDNSDDAESAAAAPPPPPPWPPLMPSPLAQGCIPGAAVSSAAEAAAAPPPSPPAHTRGRSGGGVNPTGRGASAPRVPSRLSQAQSPLPPPLNQQQQSSAANSTSMPRLAARSGSGGGSNRRTTVGDCYLYSSDATDTGNTGLYHCPAESADVAPNDSRQYNGGGAAAAAAYAAPTVQRASIRPPPQLQLPAQPIADVRSRRHSACGVLQYGILAAAAGSATAPVSLPCSPSAVSAAAAAQRALAGRVSAASGHQQYYSAPLQPLQLTSPSPASLASPPPLLQHQAALLPTLPAPQLLGSPSVEPLPPSRLPERLSERTSCPQTSVGWPLSPGGGSGAAAARPGRVSVAGMLPVRNPLLWPAAAEANAAGAHAATQRPLPPSEPLPLLLHTAGLRSRRQSTGSPAWPPLQIPAATAVAVAAAGPGSYCQSPPAPRSQPLYQLPASRIHHYSVSCSGGGPVAGLRRCGSGNGNNALSPRVPPLPALTEGGAPPAGRRSRRPTQPDLVSPTAPASAEEWIVTSRASVELETRGGYPVYAGGTDGAEEASCLGHALPPGATGLDFGAPYGAPYRPVATSTSGHLL